MQTELEKLNFWIDTVDADLKCFADKERVRKLFTNILRTGVLRYFELPEQKGITVYTIGDNFKGADCVSELFMYVRKERRGDLRLFKKLVNHLEEIARDNNCDSVKIASNIGYNDDSVLRCLQRWGYKTDVVTKEIR